MTNDKISAHIGRLEACIRTIAEAPGAPNALVDKALSELSSLKRDLTPPSSRLPLVFSVDNDREALDFVSRALEGSFETKSFASARELLESVRIAQELPSAFIVDRAMPGMTGDELVSVLKAEPRTAAIPIIMLTSRSGCDRQIEGLELGAADYLVKPVQVRILRARLGALLRTYAGARESALAEPAVARPSENAAALRLGLSGREREITGLILDGLSNKEIGDRLGISLNTVSNHIRNLYEKAGAKSRMDLARRLRE